MILILDANAVIPNSELIGATWAEISAAIDEDVLELIVPTIVIAEITGKVRANRRSQRPRTDGIHGVPALSLRLRARVLRQADTRRTVAPLAGARTHQA